MCSQKYPKWHPKFRSNVKGRDVGESSNFQGRNQSTFFNKGRGGKIAATAQGSRYQGGNTEITIPQLEQLLSCLPTTQTKPTSSDDEMEQSFARFAGMASLSSKHSDKVEWIIESGASDHMICDVSCVENVKSAKRGMKINIPNGECSEITEYGVVKLKNGLVLENVLGFPDFKHDLMSVNKLTNSGRCKVNFCAGYYVIVDCDTSKLKGLGECRNGLYYLINDDMKNLVSQLSNLTPPSGLNATKTHVSVTHGWLETKNPSDAMLWHLRLGHAFEQKLSTMDLKIKPS